MEKSNNLNSVNSDNTKNILSSNTTNSSNSSNILNSILDGTHVQKDICSNNILTDVSDQLMSDEDFWINDPMVLINKNSYFTIWPTENMSKNEKLNTLSRLIIYITIIGFIFTYSFKILVSGIVTLGIFVFLYYSSKNNTKEEFCNFSNIGNFYNK